MNAANSGVGQAVLDLLRAHGVQTIGAAATARHGIVRSYGATPIEGRTAPLDAGVRAVLPAGVDAAFDGVGGPQTGQCIAATKRGGITVWYGFVGIRGLPDVLGSALRVFVDTRLRGRRGAFYGITQRYRQDPRSFRVEVFLKGHVETVEYIKADPEETKTLVNQESERITTALLPPAVLDRAVTTVDFTYDPLATTLLVSADHAFELGFLGDEKPDLSGIYTEGQQVVVEVVGQRVAAVAAGKAGTRRGL